MHMILAPNIPSSTNTLEEQTHWYEVVLWALADRRRTCDAVLN